MANDNAATHALSELIERIYAAAANPATWPAVLADIGKHVSEGTQTILFLHGRAVPPRVLRCHNVPDSVLFPFLDYFSSVNVLAEPCDRMFPDGAVRLSHLAVDDSTFQRSEFYTDFFRPNRLFYSCGIKQTSPKGDLEYLSLQRERSLKPFSSAETAILKLLMPHVRQSLRLQAQLAAQEHRAQSLQTALSVFGKAVIALNADGQVAYATEEAEAVLRGPGPLTVVGGRLFARDPAIEEQIRHRIQAVAGLTRSFAGKAVEALLIPSPHAESLKATFLPTRSLGISGCDPCGVLVLLSGGGVGRSREPFSAGPILRQLFGLTPVQVRVADLIAGGSDVKLAASTMGKTEDVIRFHLKQIFQKTGTGRQAQLVRLLSELPHV